MHDREDRSDTGPQGRRSQEDSRSWPPVRRPASAKAIPPATMRATSATSAYHEAAAWAATEGLRSNQRAPMTAASTTPRTADRSAGLPGEQGRNDRDEGETREENHHV